MSYSKSIFFIPVWFDDFEKFTAQMDDMPIWESANWKKLWVKYLYHYASTISKTKRANDKPKAEESQAKPKSSARRIMEKRDEDIFALFTLKDAAAAKPYLYGDVLNFTKTPVLEEVRFSAFATGVGFLEFWVSYEDMTLEEITEFSYHFKKANGAGDAYKRQLPNGEKLLWDVANSLLPKDSKIFFSSAHKTKSECNCFHFIHLDQEIPEEQERKAELYRLSRSYRTDMPVSAESDYDIIYEAGPGDFWSGSPEGMANVVYDAKPGNEDYYLHTLKPKSMENDYYFMYLLLLNQKYSAVEYIRMVSLSLERSVDQVEQLSKRIVQLKNMFTFNVISDDSNFQNIYSKMYRILEIKSLLEDVIDNEGQLKYLQDAKQAKTDLYSNRVLYGLSALTVVSTMVDLATYLDRSIEWFHFNTLVSVLAVGAAVAFFVRLAIQSTKK